MYKTKKLLKWIDKKVIKYCEYLEIELPIITYNQKDFAKNIAVFMGFNVNKYTEHLRIQNSYDWGITQAQAQIDTHLIVIHLNIIDNKFNTIYDKPNMIYGNLIQQSLGWAIVHELCHLRYKGIKHGKKFDSIISKTIKECKVSL